MELRDSVSNLELETMNKEQTISLLQMEIRELDNKNRNSVKWQSPPDIY